VKIFVSYARIDASETANTIHTYLKDSGHQVFIDTSDIRGGDEWWKTIQENISNCDIFVIIVTHFAQSKICQRRSRISKKTGKKDYTMYS
jgi:TIR domain